MVSACFASFSAKQIEKIAEDKDSVNKKSTKAAKQAFVDCFSEKKLPAPTEPTELANFCLFWSVFA